jgi:hypothetical protein
LQIINNTTRRREKMRQKMPIHLFAIKTQQEEGRKE